MSSGDISDDLQSPPVPRLKVAAGIRPFRTAVLRGLGVVAPPLLTLVILLWIIRTVNYYVLEPVTGHVENLLAWSLTDAHDELADAEPGVVPGEIVSEGKSYARLPNGQYIPWVVFWEVEQSPGVAGPPQTPQEAYRRLVELKYMQPWVVVPVFIIVFVAVMYLLGSLFAAGLGRLLWDWFEHGVGRLPLVRAVYNSAKQVTNYVFSDRELEFTRVVAVEYPCRGVWSLAFVTNEGLPEVQAISREPMVTILLPTSPIPVSGYTMLVAKREIVDVAITVEQAIEYIVSCGVVLPPDHLERRIVADAAK
jgi:uncharacterized membrane protein